MSALPIFDSVIRTAALLCVAVIAFAPITIHAEEEPEKPGDPHVSEDASGSRLNGKTPAERGTALMKFVASCKLKPNDELYPKASAPAFAARLLLNIDTAYALEKLDASVASRIKKAGIKDPKSDVSATGPLDPFDKVGLVNAYFLCKEKIPASTAHKIRDYCALYAHKAWKGYGAMNYRLMMDGSGFLAAEEWPEIIDADGLSADAIKAATRERLLGYFDEIAKRNYSEFGCPIYSAVNLSAVRMLAEFARDTELKKRAGMTLDAMMVDIACTWNRGLNIGSAARAKYWGSTDTGLESMGSTAAAAWVWFGAPRSIAAAGIGWIHSFWMATPGSYKVPQIVIDIANDRAKPSVYRGYIAASGKEDIHRVTYHSINYGLCSQWDHAPNPNDGLYKEARRNMLKWVTDKPSGTFAVCMENPRRPYNLKENVANALGYGENPFVQYLQNESTLIGVYNVPDSYPYYKVYIPFTTRGAIVKRIEKGGWVFCHNGSMLMAFHSIKPCVWDKKPWNGNDMLWCAERKNAWVLETSELEPYAGGGVEAELNRFATAVLAATKIDAGGILSGEPSLKYTSLTGHALELTWVPHAAKYTGQSKIDGKPVDYASWAIHDSPWVHQDVKTPVLELKYEGKVVRYKFDTWVKEE